MWCAGFEDIGIRIHKFSNTIGADTAIVQAVDMFENVFDINNLYHFVLLNAP